MAALSLKSDLPHPPEIMQGISCSKIIGVTLINDLHGFFCDLRCRIAMTNQAGSGDDGDGLIVLHAVIG